MKSIPKTQCSSCGKFFASTAEFDGHRIGDFGKDRRCMTTTEMLDSGWKCPTAMVRLGNSPDPTKAEMPIWERKTRSKRVEGANRRFNTAQDADSRLPRAQ